MNLPKEVKENLGLTETKGKLFCLEANKVIVQKA